MKHTFLGDRGDYEVSLTMRDLYQLFRRAIEFQDMPDTDKDAVTQNFCCSVEKHLSIYPNVPTLTVTTTEVKPIKWARDGVPIPGATEDTYIVRDEDKECIISRIPPWLT